jgi:hypothetical protein
MGALRLTVRRRATCSSSGNRCIGAGVAVLIAAVLENHAGNGRSLQRFAILGRGATASCDAHSHLGGVLPMLSSSLSVPTIASTRFESHGAAAAARNLERILEPIRRHMREGYGLSEMITFVTINIDGPVGSIGKPLSYFDVRLVDDRGVDVATGARRAACASASRAFSSAISATRGDARHVRRLVSHRHLVKSDADGWLYYAGRKIRVRRRGITSPRGRSSASSTITGHRGKRAGRRAGRGGRRRIETDRAGGGGAAARPVGFCAGASRGCLIFRFRVISRPQPNFPRLRSASAEPASALGGTRDRLSAFAAPASAAPNLMPGTPARKILCSLAPRCLCAIIATSVGAQEYPSRTVTIIVPFAAGGAATLSREYRASWPRISAAGGRRWPPQDSGNIGAQFVARRQ